MNTKQTVSGPQKEAFVSQIPRHNRTPFHQASKFGLTLNLLLVSLPHCAACCAPAHIPALCRIRGGQPTQLFFCPWTGPPEPGGPPWWRFIPTALSRPQVCPRWVISDNCSLEDTPSIILVKIGPQDTLQHSSGPHTIALTRLYHQGPIGKQP